jgi:hypothetical protein
MTPAPIKAQLACGCDVGFRDGVAGSPVTVVISRKAAGCPIASHLGGMPVYDHREALRPSTRHAPPPQPDFEES